MSTEHAAIPPSHCFFFFFSSRRRHTRYIGDWSSDVCSSDLAADDVDAERIIVFQVVANGLVRFTQLLGNERMAGRVNRGQRPKRGKRLEDAMRIGGGLVCAHCSRFRALLPTRATAGLQK